MNSIKDLDNQIRLLKKEVKRFEDPVLEQFDENPFQVLISCILSLRTRDETTGPVSRRLFDLANNPQDMYKLDIRKIEKTIYSVNFYKTKARRIKDICKLLNEEYDGKVPDTIDELLKFKGVGRKTANIVVTCAYNKDGIAVDTHVHRISNRLNWVNTKNADETEQELRKFLPKKYWIDTNYYLVKFGQNFCKPINPNCGECSLIKYCKFGPGYLAAKRKKLNTK
ncbi:MAG: endonuclease III [Candidatus Aenigmarchaeota archaeon]|nr:endonuclease III [Candidatus Aenigmarchaeota archaeon]